MIAKRNRFHGTTALRWIYKGGHQARGRHIAIRVRPQDDPTPRIAVVVSRKVSKSAVVRNRIRRRLFELFRTRLMAESAGLGIIVTVYDESLQMLPMDELYKETEYLLSKARVMSTPREGRAIVKRERE